MGSALKGLTSHDYCLIFGQRIYQQVFLNWLCQYLSFLDIFFYIFYSVEKCWATPHCWYRDSLTLNTLKKSLTYNKVLNNRAKAGCHPSTYKIPQMDLFCKNCYSLFFQKKPSIIDVWLGFRCAIFLWQDFLFHIRNCLWQQQQITFSTFRLHHLMRIN